MFASLELFFSKDSMSKIGLCGLKGKVSTAVLLSSGGFVVRFMDWGCSEPLK